MIKGLWTALITPFSSDGSLDRDSFISLLQEQIQAGVEGVVVLGTTGEGSTLQFSEKKHVMEIAVSECQGTQTKVFIATGTNDTAQTRELSLLAQQKKADGLLLITPYYNKPSFLGLQAHFQAVLNGVDLPVCLYHHPGRTGICLTAKEIGMIVTQCPSIISVKEASGSVSLFSDLVHFFSSHESFSILSGDDGLYIPALSVGCHGVISVASHLLAKEMKKIASVPDQWTAFQKKYFPFFRDLFIAPNPTPIKYLLSLLGKCQDTVRLPLVGLEAHQKEKIKQWVPSFILQEKQK